jgi:hypothetical protein
MELPSLNKLQQASRLRSAKSLDKAVRLQVEAQTRQAAEDAARDVAPMVRGYLLQNFDQSGIGTPYVKGYKGTGRLRQAVQHSAVFLPLHGKMRLSMRFASGEPAKVYLYGNALAYGAVRAPRKSMAQYDRSTGAYLGHKTTSVVGARAKRTLKRVAFGGPALTQREAAFLAQRRVNAVHGQMVNRGAVNVDKGQTDTVTKKSIRMGSVVVLHPRHFFQLSAGQIQAVDAAWTAAFQARMKASGALAGE